MRYVSEFYLWAFKRLPRWFSLPLLVFWCLYTLFAFPYLANRVSDLFHTWLPAWLSRHNFGLPPILEKVVLLPLESVTILGCILLGVFLGYWLAVAVYGRVRKWPVKRSEVYNPMLPAPPPESNMGGENPLSQFKSIGIILAGGGAKGAYQAGAMKAVYEFIEKHQAHHKVRMIAGTSIGSWNALFWLAGLVKGPAADHPGLLQQWWDRVAAKHIIMPNYYLPTRHNYLLSNAPWQESFDALFMEQPAVKERLLSLLEYPNKLEAMHFYFTRSNVSQGSLEFTTNWDLEGVMENLPSNRRPRAAVESKKYKRARSVEDIREAVFASMDLPPLFSYMTIEDRYYEDGGVIDNLPVRFGTEFENCDLLFVLPLNANFEENDATMRAMMQSIVRRLFRVMNVRQGVLERDAFKMIYLYNELAGLRETAARDRQRAQKYEEALQHLRQTTDGAAAYEGPSLENIRQVLEETLSSGQEPAWVTRFHESAAEQAQLRTHNMVQVFSICPAPELVINTAEFWKTQEAGKAFRLMYQATQQELEGFEFNTDPSWIRMAQVSPSGGVTYLEDF